MLVHGEWHVEKCHSYAVRGDVVLHETRERRIMPLFAIGALEVAGHHDPHGRVGIAEDAPAVGEPADRVLSGCRSRRRDGAIRDLDEMTNAGFKALAVAMKMPERQQQKV